jgi:hypothetical protein
VAAVLTGVGLYLAKARYGLKLTDRLPIVLGSAGGLTLLAGGCIRCYAPRPISRPRTAPQSAPPAGDEVRRAVARLTEGLDTGIATLRSVLARPSPPKDAQIRLDGRLDVRALLTPIPDSLDQLRGRILALKQTPKGATLEAQAHYLDTIDFAVRQLNEVQT